jgi:hypothetical protein
VTELDASRLIVDTIRQIRASTTDQEIDEHADRIERRLARTAFAGCHWVRELLFRYRAVRVGGPEERDPFIAIVARACHRRMLRPAAAHLLDQLVSADRGAAASGAGMRG